MKVAISGFGRIGRDVTRILIQKNDPDLELVALNITSDLKTNAHLLKYDSIYRTFEKDVEVLADDKIKIGDREITVVNNRNPEELPWKELGVDLVIDSTGAFKDKEGLSKHLKAGAKKVLLTAPGKADVKMIVVGVNDKEYDPKTDDIISNASCTTNCLAPVAKVLDDEFGIEKGLMTTIHAYTNDQNIQDAHHKDLRRARAAALSMIPTTTGAAKAVGKVLPVLNGKLTGMAFRVPTSDVSVVDLTVVLEKAATMAEINAAMKEASEGELKGILGYTEDAVVSTDFRGCANTSIYDSKAGISLDSNFAKVVSWYDNEWGYSNKVCEMARVIAAK